MSKTTIILAIAGIISLIILSSVAYYVNNQSVNKSSVTSNSVSALPNQTDNKTSNTTLESSSTDSSTVEIDKTINFFVADESQEVSDFSSETSDQAQIKVDSQDLLNLSQSYENSDL